MREDKKIMDKHPVFIYKILIVGVIILFLGTCITPSVAVDNVRSTSIPLSSGNTLYVGGSGEGNYTTIKKAINAVVVSFLNNSFESSENFGR